MTWTRGMVRKLINLVADRQIPMKMMVSRGGDLMKRGHDLWMPWKGNSPYIM